MQCPPDPHTDVALAAILKDCRALRAAIVAKGHETATVDFRLSYRGHVEFVLRTGTLANDGERAFNRYGYDAAYFYAEGESYAEALTMAREAVERLALSSALAVAPWFSMAVYDEAQAAE